MCREVKSTNEPHKTVLSNEQMQLPQAARYRVQGGVAIETQRERTAPPEAPKCANGRAGVGERGVSLSLLRCQKEKKKHFLVLWGKAPAVQMHSPRSLPGSRFASPQGARGSLQGHKGHLAAGRAAPTRQRGGELEQNKFPEVSPCLQHHHTRPHPHSTSVSQGVRGFCLGGGRSQGWSPGLPAEGLGQEIGNNILGIPEAGLEVVV